MSVPEDLQYTEAHEWLRIDGDVATLGITAYATDALGDIIYIDLPQAGTILTAGERCGEIESTKSVSDLIAPADGEVLEVNAEAVDDPSLVNSAPFQAGWLLRLRVTSNGALLSAAEYVALTEQG